MHQDKHFRRLNTEAYVIAKCLIEHMGKLLITGGAGFIGSTLAKIAIGNGWDVRVLDDLSTGLKSTADELINLGIEVVFGDIRDEKLLHSVMKDCDAVAHLAAQVSVPLSVEYPEETMSINVEGTANILEACFTHGVHRMVMASSAAVYGEAESLPLREQDAGQVLSPYAESKWKNEAQILEARKKGLRATALRFFNVYGVGQRPDGAYAAVIPKFVEMMAQGKAPQVHGDGLQTRDFVHVNDVCSAILRFLNPVWYGEAEHVFNVATQTRKSLIDLIDEINCSLGELDGSHVPLKPIFGSARAGDIRHSMADITRLKNAANWKPTIKFSDGIRELVTEIYIKNQL